MKSWFTNLTLHFISLFSSLYKSSLQSSPHHTHFIFWRAIAHPVHTSSASDGPYVRDSVGRRSQKASVGLVGREVLEASFGRRRRGIQEVAKILPPCQRRASIGARRDARRWRGGARTLETTRLVQFTSSFLHSFIPSFLRSFVSSFLRSVFAFVNL